MSVNDLINFWDQTILKKTFSGHFEFLNFYLTQEMQNDWTISIKQNVMSHTRITHDKFHTKKYKMASSRPFFYLFLNYFYYYYFYYFNHYGHWQRNTC